MKRGEFITLFVSLILLAILVVYTKPAPTEENTTITQTDPTNFAALGTVVFNNPELKPNTPYLVYEEPGKPALTKELVIDADSICQTPGGAVQCVAMNVTLDVLFNGKRAVAEGISEPDGTVLLRRLHILQEGEPVFIPELGNRFTPWLEAMAAIQNCEATMVMQTHALDVFVTLKDNMRIHAVEPVIDEVFRVLEGVHEKCGPIAVATE